MQKVQLSVLWSVAVSVGPVYNQAHSHWGLCCCRKLSVMGGTGQHPSGGCASTRSFWEPLARRLRFALSELQRREGAGRSFKKSKTNKQTKPNTPQKPRPLPPHGASGPELCRCSGISHASRAMPWVTYHRGTALSQAGHSAGFCLKFRQGLDGFFLFSLLFFLLGQMHSCCFRASCALCKPDAHRRGLSGVSSTGQLMP